MWQQNYNTASRYAFPMMENLSRLPGDEIIVSIKSRPEHGRANRELVKRLAEYFGVSEQNVRIVSGFTSRKKLVEVIVADAQ
jgi:uncharacterized protein (TIGR00251 family)